MGTTELTHEACVDFLHTRHESLSCVSADASGVSGVYVCIPMCVHVCCPYVKQGGILFDMQNGWLSGTMSDAVMGSTGLAGLRGRGQPPGGLANFNFQFHSHRV